MAPIKIPAKVSRVCFGEACVGVWAREEIRNKQNDQEARLALETLVVFLILWFIFTLIAVLREMSLRRYLNAQLSALTPVQNDEKIPLMRNIVRQFEKLNEECPVQIGSLVDVEACTVCLENIDNESPVRKLGCSHIFHISCIDRWVLQSLGSHTANVAPSCPVCKASILQNNSSPDNLMDNFQNDDFNEVTNITDDMEANLA